MKGSVTEVEMAIQRWDPMRDLVELQERMRRLFDDALSRTGPVADGAIEGCGWKPPMDLFEESERYVLRVDLPGISVADVEIRVENGTLTLEGERTADAGIASEAYLRVERPQGRFRAQVELPATVEKEAIRATHSNGVIEIVLPKRQEQEPNRIRIAATS